MTADLFFSRRLHLNPLKLKKIGLPRGEKFICHRRVTIQRVDILI